ncbi:MAG: response regulator [Proteobacteria bacterium]|nr:response regulator [Pseudomonadota bacterium]
MKPATILIVEDDPSIIVSLEFLMQQEGYRVYTAITGIEALKLVKKHHPDLVLMDVMLPALSGIEVCLQLKEQERYRHLKIVLLSAKGRFRDRQDGLTAGADAYVTKPFSTGKLLLAVKNLLKGLPIPDDME